MLDFKKFSGKVGEVKKDYGVNLDSVVSKNEEIDDTDLDGGQNFVEPYALDKVLEEFVASR